MAWPLILCLVSGCDRTEDVVASSRGADTTPRLVSKALTPKVLLEEVKRRYRELSSYEDQGVVRLRYQLDGKTMVDEAPLSIAWDKWGRLGLRVYSVAAGPTGERWRMRLGERSVESPVAEQFSVKQPAFEQQVLSRSLPEKVNFDWLLFDPLIGQHLAAGMAGFPPQLDLLLSPIPLAGLVDDATQLSFAEPQKIDMQLCHRINVERPTMTYRLWIDQASGLLRRVEVPRANMPRHLVQDQRISHLELSIDLDGVRVNEAVDWKRFEVHVYPQDVLVKQFVSPPVEIDTWELGEQFPAFTLHNDKGQAAFHGGERSAQSITVMCWLADHPTCRLTVEQLAKVNEHFAARVGGQGEVNFVSVWAAPDPPAGLTFDQLRIHWGLPGALAVDHQALGRDLFRIYEAPSIIVLDEQNRLQARLVSVHPQLQELLTELLQQLADGANVAEQTLEREAMLKQRYLADLAMAIASDGEPRALPTRYPCVTFSLQPAAKVALKTAAPLAVGCLEQDLWLLTRDGELSVRTAHGQVKRRWQTDWRTVNGPQAHAPGSASLSIAPGAECVALLSDDQQRLRVLNIRNEQASELELAGDARVVDVQWFQAPDESHPRLLVIDSQARVTVLDPQDHEQLTGQCATSPLAIVGTNHNLDLHDLAIVLSDGNLEKLSFAKESLLHAVAERRLTTAAGNKEQEQRTLGFRPSIGPWVRWQGTDSMTLARGLLQPGEPAWLMLNSQLQPVWHSLAPANPRPRLGMGSVATDPATGHAVWAISEIDRTVHVLRGDGLVDHFRVAEPLVGLALIPEGPSLNLVLVHTDHLQVYEVKSRF